MKRFLTAVLASAVAGALFVASPLIAAPKGTNHNNSSDQPGTCDGGSGNSLTLRAPEKLWPPNHKYFEDINVLAVGQPDESINLTTTGSHEQYVEGDSGLEEQNGSGNTADDITTNEEGLMGSPGEQDGYPAVVADEMGTESVQTFWKARAERSGRDQTGREYKLSALAEFGDGGTCSGTVTITVPHDMRPSRR
jgi:hypothetical protein